MPLQEYKDIVGTVASLVSVVQCFAPVLICKDIVKKGNTRNVQSIPFVAGAGLCLLMLKYAIILGDFNMIPLNIFCAVLNVGYIACYYIYSNEKEKLIQQMIKAAVFFGSILIYPYFEDPQKIEFRFGMITTVLLLILIASPFAQLGEVVRTGSTESLPFPMILTGTVVSFSWLLYGFIIENSFIQVQNIVALLLSAGQLSLFVIYPSKQPKSKQKSS